MSFVAPAGTPLRLGEIASGLWQGSRSDTDLNALHAELARLSQRDVCRSFSSGRAAMVVALRAMKAVAGSRRTRVVIPGYTCYSVAAALENTGLTPVLCDVDPRTLSLDLDALARIDLSGVLAIITANLYGIPNDTAEIARIAAAGGAYLLDDAAQSLGASLSGTPAGGFGDVGLFSFDKGKNIPTMQGGALVARRGVLSEEIERQWTALPFPAPAETCMNAGKLAAYSLLLKPAYFGFVRSLPGLKLGQTPYELTYPITRYSPALAGIAVRLCRRIDEINGQRIANAERLRAALADVPGVELISPPAGAKPVYLRLPVLVRSAALRDRLVTALETAGIGATASYPSALADVPNVRARLAPDSGDTPAARMVAERILTLPTHAYSPPDLATRVRAIVMAQESA
ncbi:MAG TPA: DegT/DnrJ/EryC1/StrS family aminotransferase [Steroidobacteraceae bacterium]